MSVSFRKLAGGACHGQGTVFDCGLHNQTYTGMSLPGPSVTFAAKDKKQNYAKDDDSVHKNDVGAPGKMSHSPSHKDAQRAVV